MILYLLVSHTCYVYVFADLIGAVPAVDAHVGKALFTDAILGALRGRGKTVVLVTHALHFLSQCDYIYTLVNGRISEQGTYAALIGLGGDFARLDREFGGEQEQEQEQADAEAEACAAVEEVSTPAKVDVDEVKTKMRREAGKGVGKGKLEGRLMVAEKRTTGAVSWGSAYPSFITVHHVWLTPYFAVYGTYLAAGRGRLMMPLMITAMILMQTSQVLNSYTLVWWEAKYVNTLSFCARRL